MHEGRDYNIFLQEAIGLWNHRRSDAFQVQTLPLQENYTFALRQYKSKFEKERKTICMDR